MPHPRPLHREASNETASTLAEALSRLRLTREKADPTAPTRRPMSDHDLALAMEERRRAREVSIKSRTALSIASEHR